MSKSKNLPLPTKLRESLGPSFILLGLSLGSGELILWPYLVSQFGLGIIWGGLVGITLQYILNTEIMRYTLAWGESVFVGWQKISRLIPLWFIVSCVIPWALPGIATISASIIVYLVPSLNVRFVTIVFLFLIGIILSSGTTLYKTMERVQRTVLSLGIPFILYLVYRLSSPSDWIELGRGLIGIGSNYRFLPSGIAIGTFLGAFAYSGAGGNLGLSQSYYIKEKGMGMGRYGGKISSLFAKGEKLMELKGQLFQDSTQNRTRWYGWWRLVQIEHGIVFWGLGLLTIILLGCLSRATSMGASGSGILFLFEEAKNIGTYLFPTAGTLFLIATTIMLFSTQLGVIESAVRIISENTILLLTKNGKKVNASAAFYLSLWSVIILGIAYTINGTVDPRLLLTFGAILNAVAMMVAFPLIWYLNNKKLPKFARPSFIRNIFLGISFIFFLFFVMLTIFESLGGKL